MNFTDSVTEEIYNKANRYWTDYAAHIYATENPDKKLRNKAENDVRYWTRMTQRERLTHIQIPAVFLQRMRDVFEEFYYATPQATVTISREHKELAETLSDIFDPLFQESDEHALNSAIYGVLTCLTQMAQKRGEEARGSTDASLAQADFEKTLDACMGMLPDAFVSKMLNPEIAYCRQQNDFPHVAVSKAEMQGQLAAASANRAK